MFYTMTEMVTAAPVCCGVYCDGDLTIRLAGDVWFDADDAEKENEIGILVEGQLTIENAEHDGNGELLPPTIARVLHVNGAKAKSQSDSGSIGICADTLMLNKVTVYANGGYAGVKAKEAIVMSKSCLYANSDAEMKENGVNLFRYGLQTEHFIQCGGIVTADGDVDIGSFYFIEGNHNFTQQVTYAPNYRFAEESYSGIWLKRFKLFQNPDRIPSCMHASVGSKVAKINGNKLWLRHRGSTTLYLYIHCGRDTIIMDARDVYCNVAWWQWIPYIVTGAWIGEFVG